MRFLLITILFIVNQASGQALINSLPFSTASTYLEPDGRKDALKISEKEFVTLSKVKGALAGPSEYTLEKYDTELKQLFKITLMSGEEEDFRELYFNGSEIIVFSVIHENMKKMSKLMAYGFDVQSGNKVWEKVLDEFAINNFQPIKFKGAVRESFDNIICSSITRHYVTPFNYQYEIRFSPDNKKVLVYIYDYSQNTLLANVKVFDNKLNQLISGIAPIDNNFINYGVYPNNKGEVFILNVDRLGRMVVVKYNLETKESKFLDIQYTSTQRENLVLKVINDNVVYVGNTCNKDGRLLGVMYSKFDFSTNLIEKINYHEISDGLKQTVGLLRQSNKGLTGEESWRNFFITDFYVNEFEKVIMVLEKREVNANGFNMNLSITNEPEKWQERAARVTVEGVLMLSFNKDDELLWENFQAKHQSTDVNTGVISSSYKLDITTEGKIRMVYASASNATGMLNSINYVEWDELTGNKIKEVPLQNEEGITILRGYTLFWDDKLVLTGRKGLIGKKTLINLYKL